jgi:hypothetical protein
MYELKQREPRRLTVKANYKVATGHIQTNQGCGRHNDKRTKRLRTRAAKLRAAVEIN